MDKLPCLCAAVRAKRGELHKAAALQYNQLRPRGINADWNNSRSVELSGGGSTTLYRLDVKQAHSKAPVS